MLKIISILLISLVISNPTYYTGIQQKCDDTTKILSWHIHIVLSLTHRDIYDRAIELRERARQYFKDYIGEDCDHHFDTGRLCFINDRFDTFLEEGHYPLAQ